MQTADLSIQSNNGIRTVQRPTRELSEHEHRLYEETDRALLFGLSDADVLENISLGDSEPAVQLRIQQLRRFFVRRDLPHRL